MNKTNTRLGFAGKLKDLACLGSYVTIENDRSVLVENCRQICECSDIMAKVCAGDYFIEVWGNDLKMSEYTQDSVYIYGKVESIKIVRKSFFERRESR
jgi:hypothetical protein